jgi:predicted HTH transcriptional regulator
MSQDLIKTILNIPEESQEIEFKRLGEDAIVKKTVETVVAMANTFGGTVILGIDDPEKTTLKDSERIFGIDENKDLYDAIGRELTKVVPPISGVWPPDILQDSVTNKGIALLRVTKATDGFHSVNNDVFVRALKSNRRLNVHEITQFAYAKGFKKADCELVEVDFKLLETKTFTDWKSTRGLKGDIGEVLEKTGLARKNQDGILKPTGAAVLLFAEFTTNLLETKCAIRILQYKGTI